MREIKFRGWRGASWNIPNHMTFFTLNQLIKEEWCDAKSGFDVIMQYVGLKDVDGKDIYEGDVMEGEDAYGNKIKGTVRFRDGAFILLSDSHFFVLAGHSNHSHTYFRDMAQALRVTGIVIGDVNVVEE